MAAKKGYNFENFIRTTLMQHFVEKNIPAYVRREYQNIPFFIGTDITIDTVWHEWYFAIECKSRVNNNKKSQVLRFNFQDLFENEQFERISDFLQLSGRRGFLAIESRRGRKNRRFIIRWDELARLYPWKHKSFTLYDPAELPRPVKSNEVAARELVKKDGVWNIGNVFW